MTQYYYVPGQYYRKPSPLRKLRGLFSGNNIYITIIVACFSLWLVTPNSIVQEVIQNTTNSVNLTIPTGDYAGTQLNEEQVTNAKIIIDTGIEVGAGERDIQIALMTALQECWLKSNPTDCSKKDHDSEGLFQQRPAADWGTVEEVSDPHYAAKAFFEGAGTNNGLLDITNRAEMSLSEAAQAVQKSAFPDAYAKHEATAKQILDTYNANKSKATTEPNTSNSDSQINFEVTYNTDLDNEAKQAVDDAIVLVKTIVKAPQRNVKVMVSSVQGDGYIAAAQALEGDGANVKLIDIRIDPSILNKEKLNYNREHKKWIIAHELIHGMGAIGLCDGSKSAISGNTITLGGKQYKLATLGHIEQGEDLMSPAYKKQTDLTATKEALKLCGWEVK